MKQNCKKRLEVTVVLISLLMAYVTLIAQELPPPPPPPPATSSDQVSKADSLLQAGRLKSAIAEYKKMYNQNRTDRRIIYNYACALSLAGQAASAAFFVLQHSNAGAQEKYIGMFEAACRNNEGNWQQYALMFDRMRMNQNKPQRYGTHHNLDPAAGNTNELYQLEDETKANEWRKEIGLEPLQQYLERMNIKYEPAKGKTK